MALSGTPLLSHVSVKIMTLQSMIRLLVVIRSRSSSILLVDTACLMSEVSLGHIDTCGTHRVCLHASLSGGHLGSFTHDTPAWQTPHRHPTTGSATAVL